MPLVDTLKSNSFKSHIQSSQGNWINLAYVRKSPGNEDEVTRARLTTYMAESLRKYCHCRKIFVSDGSRIDAPILARDINGGPKVFDGNIQGMFSYLAFSTKKIRLYVIDYAGLSTDPNDIQRVIKIYKNIKELTVVHRSDIEILSHLNLKNNTVIKKFE
ncbi:hypothetical protein G6F57_001237 [Rhizopus arrhizus]|uniref:Uncharacterized protein n=1 Tax=Rhizopus oryzae TaxID=64495 RepID=A0A9P6XHI4_RHIOR|nr:hypothetical protein G6F24_001982 [Rhizopus arrhizus]KAG1413160.1 hypothetical protein G6F58_007645 [Rhizopus delemar]KAG0795412.1 hypothetical protein G6F21_002115 [Rhizopus arrhizus]KAG0796646.1 hypothetical protein G6F22_004865 [Rhizopus arrhizus]KAG0817074.1 hypothetical protein G6F20_002674 [Rhizopus arrhizus]